MRIQLVAVLLVLAMFSTAFAQDMPRYSHTGSTMITGIRVIDGLGGDAKENQDIVLIDGKIASIGPAGTQDAPKDALVIDGKGMTTMPGLIDMHVHLQGGWANGAIPGDRYQPKYDDKSAQQDFDVPDSAGPRYVRPLAGFAIAATVALAAIFGLQQTASMTDINMAPGSDSAAVAELENNGAYTVPEQVDDQLREYYMRHNASSSYFGAQSINARLVTLQLRDGVVVESDNEIVPLDEDEETVNEESTGQVPE